MVQAGTESTGKTIKFILLYVSMNKQIQDKIHEEIDQIVGRTRYPQLQDKPKYVFSYLQATMKTLNSNFAHKIACHMSKLQFTKV